MLQKLMLPVYLQGNYNVQRVKLDGECFQLQNTIFLHNPHHWPYIFELLFISWVGNCAVPPSTCHTHCF